MAGRVRMTRYLQHAALIVDVPSVETLRGLLLVEIAIAKGGIVEREEGEPVEATRQLARATWREET
jgi:hypothetical protein